MLAAFQSELRQIIVCAWSGQHEHDIHGLISNHLFTGPVNLDFGIVFLGIVARLWTALHDGIELKFRNDRDQWQMEDLCGHPIANDADVETGRHDPLFSGSLGLKSIV